MSSAAAISIEPTADAIESQVLRLVDRGADVQVELEDADGRGMTARLAHDEAAWLEIAAGDIVFVRRAATAS